MGETTLEPLPRFTTIGYGERVAMAASTKRPLSGYLGGINRAGYWVERLQDEWCVAFEVRHAIACNSATSGLLAACLTIGIKPGDTVWVSAMGMSATAACAKVLGANIVFIDIETIRFSMNMNHFSSAYPKAIIVTNLFGHPAYLGSMRSWCDSNKVWLIEDNAQSPFAMENGKYAGTCGHIGVFSLNVHKHLQCGEGGVVVTNDHGLAERLSGAINHGELSGTCPAGLNLRMTEPVAAIACVQLSKAPGIIDNRIALALALTAMVKDYNWIKPPGRDTDCTHVYYVWAARFLGNRDGFVDRLNRRGFPMRKGYSTPLDVVFRPKDDIENNRCHTTQQMEDVELITFEVCAYAPKRRHLLKMYDIIRQVADENR